MNAHCGGSQKCGSLQSRRGKWFGCIAAVIVAIGILGVLSGCSDGEATVAESSAEVTFSDSSLDDASTNTVTTAAEPADADAGTTAPSTGTNAAMLDGFTPLSQYPELPNGCEVTSLAAVLNYEGFNVDKCTLSDVYLPKGPVGSTDFHLACVGDPREEEAFGCYAPVLAQCANAYLADQDSPMHADDLTGASLRDLFVYIDNGIPVIVWGTQYCQEGYYTVTWHVDGQDLTWFRPEHCMVLVGYDLDKSEVYVSDPMEDAIITYDLDLFESRYDSIFKQAIVIT